MRSPLRTASIVLTVVMFAGCQSPDALGPTELTPLFASSGNSGNQTAQSIMIQLDGPTDFVINGEKGAGEYSEEDYESDRWYGVRGFFKWLESKTYKMHVRVLLSRYRAYTSCPSCDGGRFQPETLNYRLVTGDNVAFTLPDAHDQPYVQPTR